MTDPIEEVRRRRSEQRARQARGEGMGDGWTEAHIDALLAEIDRLCDCPYENCEAKKNTLDEARVEIADRERQIALLQDQVNALVAEKYEAKAKVSELAITVGELRAASTVRAPTATETEPELGQPDEPVSEEAALVPGASQQWFDDERAGRIRRGGEIVG